MLIWSTLLRKLPNSAVAAVAVPKTTVSSASKKQDNLVIGFLTIFVALASMIDPETIEKLVQNFEYRINLSDTVKCQEPNCMEGGLPCFYTIGKDKHGHPVQDTHYYCPHHGVANGYCETCGEYDATLGRDNRTQCLSCIQGGDRDIGDPEDFNNYGVGDPDEPTQPSIQ